jgi:hypothetical protein
MMFLACSGGRLTMIAVAGLLASASAEAASDLLAAPDAVVVARPEPVRRGPPPQDLRSIPAGGTICVNPVQNLGERSVDMSRMDEELVAQVSKTGYRAGKLGEMETCDATAYTEIVHVGGHKRISVEVEFRILLSGEQIPRLVSTASGKKAAAARDAIVEAFAQQARKIQAAQREGMVPYASVANQQD